jgi:uncharacterized protein (DUF58 family)
VTRSLSPKAAGSVLLISVLMVAGLLMGRVEPIVLAAPFVVALVWGLAAVDDPRVRATTSLETDRCLEGEDVFMTLRVEVESPVGEALVGVVLPAGLEVVDGEKYTTVTLSADEPWSAKLTVRARRWGAYEIGPVVVRAYGPGRYSSFESTFPVDGSLRVYPPAEPLRRGVPPQRTQVFAGNYVSRAAGEGIEFASVREFASTDDVKRINWRVTSRRDALYINVYHPERNSDIVLFLDTFGDVGPPGETSLDLAVRGAAALARHYLTHKDRVGLVNFGGTLGWITAGQGQPHTYRIVDYLLGTQATWSFAWKDLDYLPIGILPSLCTIVAFSPLLDERAVTALVNLQARGFPLVIVDTLRQTGIEPNPTPEGLLAWRVWKMERAAVDLDLERLGIPVVQWPEHGPLEAALARVPELRRRPRARGA